MNNDNATVHIKRPTFEATRQFLNLDQAINYAAWISLNSDAYEVKLVVNGEVTYFLFNDKHKGN